MAKQEADEYIIRYWEATAKDNEERANGLEELATHVLDKDYADFMRTEAKVLREQAARFRETARMWRE